jgi:periplasmic copper chaperone A
MRRRLLLAALLLAAAASPPPVRATDPWVRGSLPGQTDASVYMTLTAWSDDAVLGADSPDANTTLLHRIDEHGSVVGRRLLSSLPLPAAKPVVFRPGVREITLIGLRHPLRRGETVTVTLRFHKAPPLTVLVPVRKVGAMGPADLQ